MNPLETFESAALAAIRATVTLTDNGENTLLTALRAEAVKLVEAVVGEDEDYSHYVEPHTYFNNPEKNMGHLKEIELTSRNRLRAEQRARVVAPDTKGGPVGK